MQHRQNGNDGLESVCLTTDLCELVCSHFQMCHINYTSVFMLCIVHCDTVVSCLAGKIINVKNAMDLNSCKNLTVYLVFLCLCSQYYSAHAAYCHSKLAQVLFSSQLHQELQSGGYPLSSCAVDPGMVNTALYRHLWTPLCLAQSVIARLLFRVKLSLFLLAQKPDLYL